MNIFATDSSPRKSAQFLDDRRLVKMALETTQIISTVLRDYYNISETPYKSTHINHPCTKWAAENPTHLKWLFLHGIELCTEYRKRFGRAHKCLEVIHQCIILYKEVYGNEFPSKTQPDYFPNCTVNKDHGINMKWIKDPHVAYRCYLYERWKHDKYPPKRNRIPINLEY